MSKQIGSIEIKYSKNGIMLQEVVLVIKRSSV